MERKICAFTGHRRIKPEHIGKLTELLSRAVNYAYGEGCLDFCAGGALGFDTYAAREVIKFRMSHPECRLILILPHLGQSDRWTSGQKNSYDYILAQADEVIYISDGYYDGCMKERNMRLVEHAEMLIAYVGRSDSGAAQTARMAKARGIAVHNLYPAVDES